MIRAGVGRACITPDLPVMLAGFGDRNEAATEVHDDLEVRVLHLANVGTGAGDPPRAVCLVVCDLLGMSSNHAEPIRAAVAGALGLPHAAVLTASTHTHSGPSCIAGSEAVGWPCPEGYRELLVTRCVQAARQAEQSAVPSTLAYRRAPLPDGLSVNRRSLPYAPWLALLDVQDLSGTRVGTLANLAVHPVALGPECRAVSADWVHPFRRAAEAALGGTAIMLSGALGDVNPRHVHRQENACPADGFAEADELGTELAQAVAAEVPGAQDFEGVVEIVRSEEFSAPVGGTLLSTLTATATMSVELIEWAIGEARLVSVPGEAFHAFGNALAAARPGPLLVAGLAPAWLGYLPVPFTEGYEEQMSMGRPFVDALYGALIGTVTPS